MAERPFENSVGPVVTTLGKISPQSFGADVETAIEIAHQSLGSAVEMVEEKAVETLGLSQADLTCSSVEPGYPSEESLDIDPPNGELLPNDVEKPAVYTVDSPPDVLQYVEDLVSYINQVTTDSKIELSGTLKSNFLQIIYEDDITSMRNVYERISLEHKISFYKLVLKGDDVKVSAKNSECATALLKQTNFRLGPILAAFFGSKDIVRFYCENFTLGVLDIAENDHNIIHALVLGCHLKQRCEEAYLEMYTNIFNIYKDCEKRTTLLHFQNSGRLRPLEVASKLEQYTLVKEILETEHVYKFRIQEYGPHLHITYNVSEYYTIGARRDKSPLHDIVQIREDSLPALRKSGLLKNPLIRSMIRSIIRENLIVVLLWMAFRITIVIFALSQSSMSDNLFLNMNYILLTEDTSMTTYKYLKATNSSSEEINATIQELYGKAAFNNSLDVVLCYLETLLKSKTQASTQTVTLFDELLGISVHSKDILLIVLCILSFTFDILDSIVSLVRGQISRTTRNNSSLYSQGSGAFVVNNHFYRITFFMMTLSYIAFFTLGFICFTPNSYVGSIANTIKMIRTFAMISSTAFAVSKILTIWSLLYFIQLFPGLGLFVIGFQRMMMALVHFIVIFALIFVSFALTFNGILSLDCTHPEFIDIQASFYSSLLLMLNMLDLRIFDVQIQGIVFILHFVFVMIVTILIINFLIALMSSRYAEMTEYGDIIHKLCSLDVALTAARRFAAICPCRRKKRNDSDVIVVTIPRPNRSI
jgi:hypothetical protein